MSVIQALSGYKTYLVAVALGLLTVAQTLGWLTVEQAATIQTLLLGAGLAALRQGVKADATEVKTTVAVATNRSPEKVAEKVDAKLGKP